MTMIAFFKYIQAYINMQSAMRRIGNHLIEWIDINGEEDIKEMMYYRKYAIGIYGKNVIRILVSKRYLDLLRSIPDRQVFCEHCEIADEDVILCRFSAEKFTPAHILVRDHHKKSIVLTIRGTYSMHDIFTDINADVFEYSYRHDDVETKGWVHSGIFTCAQNISDRLKKTILEELSQCPYNLVIAGHSLGAGVASLLSMI